LSAVLAGCLPGRLRAAFAASGLARAVRFCLVGASTTLLYALVAWAGVSLVGLSGWAASAGAYAFAGLASYAGHRRVTFRSARPHGRAAWRFAVVALAGSLAAVAAPALTGGVLGWPPLAGIAAACVAIPLANAVALSRFVFGAPLRDP
jgi:putative flippase GtrA